MMGGGGAMMLWRLAWLRAFPMDKDVIEGRRTGVPYTPAIEPLPRHAVRPENRASWEYHRLLDTIDLLTTVWPPRGRPARLWLDGTRHNLNTDIAA
jgi:hypothetical protein